MHKQSFFIAFTSILLSSTYTHSAHLRTADVLNLTTAFETKEVTRKTALFIIRNSPTLAAIPSYNPKNGAKKAECFNTTVQAALILIDQTELHLPFILTNGQESSQTLSDLKNTEETPSQFIQSLQPVSGK